MTGEASHTHLWISRESHQDDPCGNTKKKETAPEGSEDDNVFDIRQAIAICLMVRLRYDANSVSRRAIPQVGHHAGWR